MKSVLLSLLIFFGGSTVVAAHESGSVIKGGSVSDTVDWVRHAEAGEKILVETGQIFNLTLPSRGTLQVWAPGEQKWYPQDVNRLSGRVYIGRDCDDFGPVSTVRFTPDDGSGTTDLLVQKVRPDKCRVEE